MADKKKADSVPEVKIETGLPELPEGTVLWPFASPWRNGEREFALGIITTAAVRRGGWQAVDIKTFLQILQGSPFQMMAQGVISAVWKLAGEEYLDIVMVEGKGDYIVPHAKLANVLSQCTLRYA